MTTSYVTVSIGNSDNKLTQKEWNQFVVEMDAALHVEGKIHFFGASPNYEPWQNVAWILETDSNLISVEEVVRIIRKRNKQDSAFFLHGLADFV